MDNLNSLIESRKNELSMAEIPHLNERLFFDEIFKQYNANNINTYLNLSNCFYLTAILVSGGIKLSFDDLLLNMSVIEEFIDKLDFNHCNYQEHLVVLKTLYDKGLLEKIVNDKNLVKLNKEEKKLYIEYENSIQKLFVEINENSKKTFNHKLVEAFNNLFFALPQISKFESFIYLKTVGTDIRGNLNDLWSEELGIALEDDAVNLEKIATGGRGLSRYIEKQKDRFINKQLKDIIQQTEYISILEDYQLMQNHYQQLTKEDKAIVISTNKKIRSLEDLEHKLKYINPSRLVKIDEDTERMLFDPEIKYHYLLIAIKNNLIMAKKEEQRNVEFNNNSLTKFDILFSKYGYNFNDFNEEEKNNIINKTSVNEVENILNLIKYSELNFISDYNNEFMKIIVFSKPDIIKFIDALLKNKMIDRKFIFKHINILFDTCEFENLHRNISCLVVKGINVVNLVKDNSNILLFDNNELITKLNIINEYNLRLDKDDIYKFNILTDNKILDLLDNFIELGFKDMILDNPRYLTKQGFDIIKRLMICNLIGFNPINKSNKIIGAVSTGNDFYVSPEEYDNFIIDYKLDYQNPICTSVLDEKSCNIISLETKNNFIIKKMDELYMRDSLTYDINGILISRNRVIRNMEVLLKYLSDSDINIKDLLYQAILYKMINNIEPIVLEQIYDSIYGIELEDDKTYTLK